VQNDWSSPSGSRWEPVPQPGGPASPVSPGTGTVPVVERAPKEPRRRHRRPVVAVLLTVLGAGAVTGGAAYAEGDGAGASAPAAPTSSHVAGDGDHGGRHAHGPHGSSS
jgi:hypothetical protein